MDNYQLACHLHTLGFSVIPLSSTTKRPARKWTQYQTERCTHDDLVDWFQINNFQPAIVTGAVSGIIVVDCGDFDAITSNPFPPTQLSQRTNRGKHFVYRHPRYRVRNLVRVNDHAIDVRADGGYVVAYPDSLTWTTDGINICPAYPGIPQAVPPESDSDRSDRFPVEYDSNQTDDVHWLTRTFPEGM